MAINLNWKLGRRASACHHGGRKFEDGESIVTVVLPLPDSDEFERRDYTLEGWEEARASVEPFSFWRTRFELPVAQPKQDAVVEKESAESLLRRLIDEDDPKTENARYVLAVMLERRRNLKEVERKDAENGSRLLIYEQPKTGDILIVRDPMLHLDELEPVQQEVSELLAPKPAAPPEENSGDENEPAEGGDTGEAPENSEDGEEEKEADEGGAEAVEKGEAMVGKEGGSD